MPKQQLPAITLAISPVFFGVVFLGGGFIYILVRLSPPSGAQPTADLAPFDQQAAAPTGNRSWLTRNLPWLILVTIASVAAYLVIKS
jgi:hypothetical protein